MRPAASLFFQALKALMRSSPDQGTVTDGSTRLAASASVTNRRPWLYANLDAPAQRASICSCAGVGSRESRNVVYRIAVGPYRTGATDLHAYPQTVDAPTYQTLTNAAGVVSALDVCLIEPPRVRSLDRP
jgi:hypothetical protein